MVTFAFEPLGYLLMNGLSNLAYQCWLELDSTNGGDYAPDWEAYQRMVGEYQGLQSTLDMIDNMLEEEEN